MKRKTMRFGNIPIRESSSTTEHLTSIATSKALGMTAGTFQIQIKSDRNLLYYIQDGDWVDITLTRHTEKHHVMRGIIMSIEQDVSATSGPTVATYKIVGSEFSLIFAEQQFWFDQITQGDYFPRLATKIWSQTNSFMNGRPDVTVAVLLRSFLQPGNNAGAGFWHLPKEMPVVGVQGVVGLPLDESADEEGRSAELEEALNFVDVFTFVDGYSNTPPRTSGIIPSNFTSSAASVWDLAKEFADEMICEFFTDLVVIPEISKATAQLRFDPPQQFAGYDANAAIFGDAYIRGPVTSTETSMAVIFRDAPFPNSVRDKNFIDAPYFSLPLTVVEPQHVLETRLARNGEVRKNTVFFGPVLQQDTLGTYHDFQLPLVDIESIRHHGIRRIDAQTRYITDFGLYQDASEVGEPSGGDVNTAADEQPMDEAAAQYKTQEKYKAAYRQMAYEYRDIVRDLHCMNHLLQTGEISLNHGRPEVRIGTRFRIAGATEDTQFTCYVEGVQHDWNYATGLRTSLTVSHGWQGSDTSYVNKLRECIDRFTVFKPEFRSGTDLDTEGDDGGEEGDGFADAFVSALNSLTNLGSEPREREETGPKNAERVETFDSPGPDGPNAKSNAPAQATKPKPSPGRAPDLILPPLNIKHYKGKIGN